jgi:hypothetical protein
MINREQNARASWTVELTVLGLFILLTLSMTYPLVFHMRTHVPSDIGDPSYTMWAIDWEMKQAGRGFGQFFNGNNFYPHKGTLLYADFIPGLALLAAPFVLLTGSLVEAYNILFLASFVLCAWAMYRLVLYLARDRSAAFVAGLIFAFFNYRFAHLSHLEILFFGWMPLFFLSLLKWIDRPAFRHLLGAGIYFVLQTWCCAYYGAYFAPFAALAAVYLAVKTRAFLRPGFWKSVVGLGLVTLPFLAAFYIPFVLVHDRMFFSRGMDEVMRYSAQLQFFTSITRGTLFWGFLLPSQESSEWILYPGFIAVLLALAGGVVALVRYGRELRAERKIALAAADAFLFLLLLAGMQIHKPRQKPGGLYWGVFPLVLAGLIGLRFLWAFLKARRLKRSTAAGGGSAALDRESIPRTSSVSLALRFFLFTSFFAFLLSLGPVARLNDRPLFTGPYLLFYKFLPGFQGMRASGRFVVIMMLALAVLAGWAVARLRLRIKARAIRAGLVGLIGILVLADYAILPIKIAPVPLGERIPPIYQVVKSLPPESVLIELPMPSLSWVEEDWRNVLPMYFSTIHGKSTVNGYSGYYPPGYTVVRDAMEGFPERRTLKFLRDIGATHVLIHTQAHRAEDGQAQLKALTAQPGQAELIGAAAGDFLFRLNPAPPAAPIRPGREIPGRGKWSASARSNRQQARSAIDGNPDTGWASKTNQQPGEFFLVDLTTPTEISQIELVQGGDPLGYPRAFVVEGSMDRNAWSNLADIPVGIPDVTAATIEDFTRYRMLIDFPPAVVRYVRIRLTAPHRTLPWSLYELLIRR